MDVSARLHLLGRGKAEESVDIFARRMFLAKVGEMGNGVLDVFLVRLFARFFLSARPLARQRL